MHNEVHPSFTRLFLFILLCRFVFHIITSKTVNKNPKNSEALITTPSDFLEDRDDDEADDDEDDDADEVLLDESDFSEESESEASSFPGILHAHWVDALNPLPSGLLLPLIYFKAPPGVSGTVLVTFHDDDSAGQTDGSCDD